MLNGEASTSIIQSVNPDEENAKHRRNTGLANLRPPWKPGECGNLSGRPKGSSIAGRMKTLMAELEEGGKRTVAEGLAESALHAARKGDFRFYKEIIDRVDGPIKQHLEAEVSVVGVASLILGRVRADVVVDPDAERAANDVAPH